MFATKRFALRTTRANIWKRLATGSSFVSKHYELDNPGCIPEFLERKKISFSVSSSHYRIRECPFCHDIKGQKDNMFKLHIDRIKGLYFCHRCGSRGNWLGFRHKLSNGETGYISAGDSTSRSVAPAPIQIDLVKPLDTSKATQLQHNLKHETFYRPVLDYLTKTRGLSIEVLDKYGVGCTTLPESDNATWITFPWMARDADLVAMNLQANEPTQDINAFHVIRLKARCWTEKSKQLILPKGGSWGLFGWHTVPTTATALVLTEGEYDAMAVHQATGLPAISLPNGCRSLPPSVLPLLERIETIYLWLDNDVPGQESAAVFARKLGLKRCRLVRPAGHELLPNTPDEGRVNVPKDANEALLRGWDIQKMIDGADVLPHRQLATFEELRHDVFHELLNPIQAAGVQSRQFPTLNAILKGLRKGEVSIVTGPTGCGKTTLLSQLSLDFCQQGINTLWGSFEIKNTRLLHKMLHQMSGKSLSKVSMDELETIADEFQELPMYFLRFFGSTDVDEVLDVMEHAVYTKDVQHVVLDNMQFMMSGQGRGFDKFERQDIALDKFRKFATSHNVHLTLVIHPRKEQEDSDLTITSIFGTAKATQEADNVMILQRDAKHQVKLDIRKNRFDGSLGSIPLMFDADSCRLEEVSQRPMSDNVAAIDAEVEAMRMPSDLFVDMPDEPSSCVETPELEPAQVTLEQLEPRFQSDMPESEPFSQFTQIIHR